MVSAGGPRPSMPEMDENFRRNLLVELDELVELGDHGARMASISCLPSRPGERRGGGHEHGGLDVDGVDAGALGAFDQHLTVPSGSLSICRMLAMQPIR